DGHGLGNQRVAAFLRGWNGAMTQDPNSHLYNLCGLPLIWTTSATPTPVPIASADSRRPQKLTELIAELRTYGRDYQSEQFTQATIRFQSQLPTEVQQDVQGKYYGSLEEYFQAVRQSCSKHTS